MKRNKIWKFLCVAAVFAVLVIKCRQTGDKRKESREKLSGEM